MSVSIELSLLSSGIPYKIEGHDSALKLREINALIGVLKLANGTLYEQDEYSTSLQIEHMLSIPHIGLKADEMKRLISNIIKDPENVATHFVKASQGLKDYHRQSIAERASLWNDISTLSDESPETILAFYIETSDLFNRLIKMSASADDAEDQIASIEGFEAYSKSKKLSLHDYLEHINELRENEIPSDKTSIDHVLITSVHRSKGLEWPLVILPGLSEGKFPHIKSKRLSNYRYFKKVFPTS